MYVLALVGAVSVLVLGVAVLGTVVAIHEFGHFVAARLLDIGISEFSIGLGPVLFSWKRRDTRFAIRAFPLGGYVKVVSPDGRLLEQPLWKRALFVVAGPMANIIFAWIIAVVLLKVGAAGMGRELPIGSALLGGINLIGMAFQIMVSGLSGLGPDGGLPIMGPAGVLGQAAQAIIAGPRDLLIILFALHFSLSIFNLLPLPPLDGGRLLLYAVEAVRRRPLSAKVEDRIVAAGVVALMVLFFAASINDLLRM